MSSDLAGKVAVITGAARGQGRAEAVRLASDGADIVLIDVGRGVSTLHYALATVEDLEQSKKLVESTGRRALTFEVDVRDASAMQTAITTALDDLGRIDIVVANAGICSYGSFTELSGEHWQETIDVNVHGVVNTIKPCIGAMVAAGHGGSIVVTSSVAGVKGMPLLSHYAASKHAVSGLCRSLALELAQHNIRVNTVHPNGVRTEMIANDELRTLLSTQPYAIQSLYVSPLPYTAIDPEDVAGAVSFLVSDEGRYITGTEFLIDLGRCLR